MNASKLFLALILSFILCITASVPSVAQSENQHVIDVSTDGNKLLTGNSLYLFEDPSGNMPIEQVLKKTFFPASQRIPNFGYSGSTIWIRLIVNTESTDDEAWKVDIENPNLNEVTWYKILPDGNYTPLSPAPHQATTSFLLQLSDPLQTILIRIKSHEALLLPIQVINTTTLAKRTHRMDLLQGFYYGMIFSLIVFNVYVFLSLREKNYLTYILYILAMSVLVGHQTGYLKLLRGSHASWVASYAFLSCITVISGLRFATDFIQLKRNTVIRWTEIFIGVSLVTSLLLHFLYSERLGNVVAAVVSFGTVIFVFFILFRAAFYDAYRPAWFLLLGWAVLLTSIIVYIATDFGLLPYSVLTHYSPQIGSGMEATLISYALSDKLSLMRKSIEVAREREREIMMKHNRFVSNQNAALEAAVIERTLELEKSNHIKDRFFSIVAHDLRNPLHTLAALLEVFQSDILERISKDQFVALSQKLGASVSNTLNLTDNLLIWAKSQMHADQLIPEPVDLQELVDLTIRELHNIAIVKNIRLQLPSATGMMVTSDRNHAQFILRNLISNAIKYTPPGGTVTVTYLPIPGFIELLIQDTGVGMNSETLTTLFSVDVRKSKPGTNGEKGTGLGLSLCKEFATRNNGYLKVESHPGEGSVFKLALPVVTQDHPAISKTLS